MAAYPVSLADAARVAVFLRGAGTEPILYGSLGVSLYIGQFKQFQDIDLLIDDVWLGECWPDLVMLLKKHGFALVDEREHEFRDAAGLVIAFAGQSILMRDHVINAPGEIVGRTINDQTVRTLTAAAFRRAYQFSSRDGYRLRQRGKKDMDVVASLDHYLHNRG